MHEAEITGSNSARVTLNSSKLKWLSILSYTLITLAVIDRDPERSGGASIYGAIPNNDLLLYSVAALAGVQSAAYIHLSLTNMVKICRVDRQSVSETPAAGLHDLLNQRKCLGLLYWVLASVSCLSAILNSLYLILFFQNENDAVRSTADFTGGNDTVSKVNLTVDRLFIQSAENHGLSSLAFNESYESSVIAASFSAGSTFNMLKNINGVCVSSSVWAWNAANLIEVSVFILCRFKRDKCNAMVSTVEFISNVARTLIINKMDEDYAYPIFVIAKWLSLPYYASYKRVRHYLSSVSSGDADGAEPPPELPRVMSV